MRGSWPLILALWGAGLGAAGQYAKISMVYDLLAQAYPQGGALLSWIVSSVGALGVVLGVVAAMLVARVRYRRALLGALWLGAGLSACQALLPPLPVMLVLRLVEGVSHLAIVVAAPTLIAQIATGRQRALALTLWGTFFGVAFTVMAWGGRPLALSSGLPALFAAHAAYMAAFALYLAPRLKALPREGEMPDLSPGAVLRTHAMIYRSPHIAAPAIGWLFYAFCFVSIFTVLPPYLAPHLRGAVLGAMPLVSIAVSMTLGVMLLRRFKAVHVVISGFALSALAMLWLWIAPAAPAACFALAGAMGLIQGSSFAAVPQLNITARTQTQANGAIAQMGNLGNTLGPPVMVVALAAWGYPSLPVLAGAAFGMGLILHIFLAVLRRKT